jgi:ABC-type dipeptide/oligopeptide/nickel transport system permease subunit
MTRSALRDALHEDHVRAARAVGLSERRVLWRHALPAALPAVLARRDLRHPGEMAARGLGDRLAVLAAAALRRV